MDWHWLYSRLNFQPLTSQKSQLHEQLWGSFIWALPVVYDFCPEYQKYHQQNLFLDIRNQRHWGSSRQLEITCLNHGPIEIDQNLYFRGIAKINLNRLKSIERNLSRQKKLHSTISVSKWHQIFVLNFLEKKVLNFLAKKTLGLIQNHFFSSFSKRNVEKIVGTDFCFFAFLIETAATFFFSSQHFQSMLKF